jgi:hypothetical protein
MSLCLKLFIFFVAVADHIRRILLHASRIFHFQMSHKSVTVGSLPQLLQYMLRMATIDVDETRLVCFLLAGQRGLTKRSLELHVM